MSSSRTSETVVELVFRSFISVHTLDLSVHSFQHFDGGQVEFNDHVKLSNRKQ